VAGKNLLFAAALVVLAACSENPISPDPTVDARSKNGGTPSRPADAAQMDKIARNSQAQWMDGGTADVFTAVNNAVTTAAAVGSAPVLVAYNIPQRDCGGLSAGGTTITGYKGWIAAFASGLAGRKAIVILEPDALTQMDCLSAADQTMRVNFMSRVPMGSP
jgi:endoglucanase